MSKDKDKDKGKPVAAISLQVPDSQAVRVANAICARHGWTAAGGLTKAEFTRQWLARTLKEEVAAHEAALAAAAAKLAAEAAVETEVVIT